MANENLFIKQIMVGPMMNYAYIIGDKSTKDAAIIDPGFEADRLIQEVEKEGLNLKSVLLTHTHFDHANDVAAIAKKKDVKIYVHEMETKILGGLPHIEAVKDEDSFNIGGIQVKVINTPGHTSGSVCYQVDQALFTGDTLFIDAIGRTDLEGGDVEAMFKSLAKLRDLPDNLIVYPGHHYGHASSATLGEEKKTNPYLSCSSDSDFLRIA